MLTLKSIKRTSEFEHSYGIRNSRNNDSNRPTLLNGRKTDSPSDENEPSVELTIIVTKRKIDIF